MQIFLPIIVFIFSIIPILIGSNANNALILFLHIIMTIICIRNLFTNKGRPYSLFKVMNIFFLFFMCIAPIVQLNNNISFFGTRFSIDNYFTTSFTLFLVLISSTLIYNVFSKKYDRKYSIINAIQSESSTNTISIKKEFLLLIIAGIISFICLYVNQFNLNFLFFREGEIGEVSGRVSMSQITSLLFNSFLRPITLTIFLSSLILKLRHKFTKVILFVFLIISVPPTGIARLLAAAVYIPVVLFTIPVLRKNNNFVLLFCFGILVVFPLLNIFRHYSEHLSFDISTCFSQFEELHFDAYSMMMRVIKDDIVTYGTQLLGALCFWIPRTLWSAKPIGSGHFVAEQTNLSFSNLSMPFWGEGYINFGYFGVALFTIVLAVFIARTDSKFWNITVKQERNLDTILYYLLLGLLMFVLRGDMMSGTAYTCGILCSYYFIKKIVL